MKVEIIHKRRIKLSKAEFAVLLETLSSKNDKVWPSENWPPIRFKSGLKIVEIGGHGSIKYSIEDYIPGELIVFKFIEPNGFEGIHKFEVEVINFFGLFIYCLVQFFNVESTKELLKWGLGSIVFLLGVSMLKVFAWMQMDKNAIIRELKRLELQVSSLSGRMSQ